MRKFVALALPCVALLLVGLTADRLFAQDASNPPAAKETKEDKIRRLLKLNGAEDNAKLMMDRMTEQIAKMPGLPAGFAAKMKERASTKDLVEMIVPIYAKHFDEPTLDAVIVFLESPAGLKMTAEQPAILNESMNVGVAWGKKLGADIARELQEGK